MATDVLRYLTREQREMVWWLEESRHRRQAYFQACALTFMELSHMHPMFIEWAKENMQAANEEAAR